MKCDNFMESSLRQLLVLLWQYLLSSVNQKVQVVDINIYSQEWLWGGKIGKRGILKFLKLLEKFVLQEI